MTPTKEGIPLVFEMVLWKDHCSTGSTDWAKFTDILDLSPIEVCTVGWIMKETDEYLILCSTFYSPDGDHAPCGHGDIMILKNCVVHRSRLVCDPASKTSS